MNAETARPDGRVFLLGKESVLKVDLNRRVGYFFELNLGEESPKNPPNRVFPPLFEAFCNDYGAFQFVKLLIIKCLIFRPDDEFVL